MDDIEIRDDVIRLGQFLKLANFIDSGADAKALLERGQVTVNGEVETRRGRQLHVGDIVSLGTASARVAHRPIPRSPRLKGRETGRITTRRPRSTENWAQTTSIRSTTKMRVSPGWITPPAPRSP